MSKKINVAIVGLGRIGSTFLEKLLEYKGRGISIVAVAEINAASPGLELARKHGLTIFQDDTEMIDMGDKIDIIFELTGSHKARRDLRMAMVQSSNSHTVIAPEIVAFLIWDLIAKGKELPEAHLLKGY
ncbi:MAG: serine kinase [bacterium]|nr:serine kinase [bacterium]